MNMHCFIIVNVCKCTPIGIYIFKNSNLTMFYHFYKLLKNFTLFIYEHLTQLHFQKRSFLQHKKII